MRIHITSTSAIDFTVTLGTVRFRGFLFARDCGWSHCSRGSDPER